MVTTEKEITVNEEQARNEITRLRAALITIKDMGNGRASDHIACYQCADAYDLATEVLKQGSPK